MSYLRAISRLPLLLIALIYISQVPAQADSRARGRAKFLQPASNFLPLTQVNRRKEVLCRVKDGAPGIGIRFIEGTNWKSFSTMIRDVARRRDLSARTKRLKLRSLRARRKLYKEQCVSLLSQPDPTAVATAAPSKTPGVTPLPEASPTPTHAPTASPTFTPPPTATFTASPTATASSTSTPTTSPTFTPTPTATFTPTPTPWLRAEPNFFDFGTEHVGETTDPHNFVLTNESANTIILTSIFLGGFNPGDFHLSAGSNIELAPGESTVAEIAFSPTLAATRLAQLVVVSSVSANPLQIPVQGHGLPNSSPDPIRINCGGSDYTDSLGRAWSADSLFIGGQTANTSEGIGGTSDDVLYQSERYGNSLLYQIPAPGHEYHVRLHFAEIYWGAPGFRVFDVELEGAKVLDDFDIFEAAGALTAHVEEFDVHVHDGVLDIQLSTEVDNAKISAIEVLPPEHLESHPYLHVVMHAPEYLVDYDQNGSEPVMLDGSGSHTHEPGRGLQHWFWSLRGQTLGDAAVLNTVLPVASNLVTLTIEDTDSPPDNLSSSLSIPVYPPDAVQGVLARYYLADSGALLTLLDSLPPLPQFIEQRAAYEVISQANGIGGSGFTQNTVVSLQGAIQLAGTSIYQFQAQGGMASRIFIDGQLVTGPINLAAGQHAVEARFAVQDLSQLPLRLVMGPPGGPLEQIDFGTISHDETQMLPFINTMPSQGYSGGGEPIVIEGKGFFPPDQAVLHWGNQHFGAGQISIAPDRIELITPPGNGPISVQVETPNGVSNILTFTYSDDAPVPLNFDTDIAATDLVDTSSFPFSGPTQMAWGPDGRLYIGSTAGGQITVLRFDDSYNVVERQEITTLLASPNGSILGIGFNPFDPPQPVRLYVAHSQLFADGGTCIPDGWVSNYNGKISVLEGPSFSTVSTLVSGLPVSNHDHAVNGLAFDNYRNMLVALGGNTNAGVPACAIGELPESPLSGAVASFPVGKANFNGSINYVISGTLPPQQDNDQVHGDTVDVAAGVDAAIKGAGMRNPFDLVWTTSGHLYATDNGPNAGFGPASTGPDSEGPDPSAPDELLLVRQGHYYGHANRNRGRTDFRQNIYRGPFESPLNSQYSPPLATLNSSTDGIDEYRATTFRSQLRGSLLLKHLSGVIYLARFDGTPYTLSDLDLLANIPGLDILTGPGGAILVTDYYNNQLVVLKPQDATAPAMTAFDIFPWRAPAAGGAPFVIGGQGFGSLSDTSVSIGGVPAALDSVSTTRIRGTIPPSSANSAAFLDLQVQSGSANSTISAAFRYLLPPGTGSGVWSVLPALPHEIGEVGAAVANGVMYLFGHIHGGMGHPTLAFDPVLGLWRDDLAERPIAGDHHAVEATNGKVYVLGGLPEGGSAPGNKVQIYDPASNSWSLGADIPFSSGSASSAVINGLIYYAGGISGGSTTNAAAVYNPAANQWQNIAPMPVGRNHSASGTDGSRFYIFGGRDGGNVVSAGFNDVMIYDPESNSWEWSGSPGSTLPPLPQARGGMGKAAFLDGEFYVIGGETVPGGQGAVEGNVYNRVDVFNPATRSWRLEAALPTPRHGIFPLAYDGEILVAGGGTQAGHSQSEAFESFAR